MAVVFAVPETTLVTDELSTSLTVEFQLVLGMLKAINVD